MSNASSANSAHELSWFKSSYSSSEGGNCVEVAARPTTVLVRDSKNTGGPQLALAAESWAIFIDRVRA